MTIGPGLRKNSIKNRSVTVKDLLGTTKVVHLRNKLNDMGDKVVAIFTKFSIHYFMPSRQTENVQDCKKRGNQ